MNSCRCLNTNVDNIGFLMWKYKVVSLGHQVAKDIYEGNKIIRYRTSLQTHQDKL